MHETGRSGGHYASRPPPSQRDMAAQGEPASDLVPSTKHHMPTTMWCGPRNDRDGASCWTVTTVGRRIGRQAGRQRFGPRSPEDLLPLRSKQTAIGTTDQTPAGRYIFCLSPRRKKKRKDRKNGHPCKVSLSLYQIIDVYMYSVPGTIMPDHSKWWLTRSTCRILTFNVAIKTSSAWCYRAGLVSYSYIILKRQMNQDSLPYKRNITLKQYHIKAS